MLRESAAFVCGPAATSAKERTSRHMEFHQNHIRGVGAIWRTTPHKQFLHDKLSPVTAKGKQVNIFR